MSDIVRRGLLQEYIRKLISMLGPGDNFEQDCDHIERLLNEFDQLTGTDSENKATAP